MHPFVTLDDIIAAQSRYGGLITRTPLVRSDSLSERVGGDVFSKLESLQPTGSFKVRGVSNKMSALTVSQRDKGLITVSSGNHGRELAWASRRLDVQSTICLYENVPVYKIEAIRRLGGNIEICGSTYEKAEHAATRLCVSAASPGLIRLMIPK